MAYIDSRRQAVDWSYWLPTVVFVTMWLILAWGSFVSWRTTGRPLGIGFAALELLTVILFVARRQALQTNRSHLAWIVTGVASFAPLAMRRTLDPMTDATLAFELLQFIGLTVALVSLCSLGRSFGLVAANRGVQTRGAYQVVRHPIYSSYLITQGAFLLANLSLYNASIFIAAWIFQLIRIGQEETLLGTDSEYAKYMARVRYRLIPFLY